MRSSRAWVLSVAMLCAVPACSQVEMGYMDTVAWLAADSDVVVTGRIVGITDAVPKSSQRLELVKFKVDETYKGPRQRELQFVVASIPGPGHLDRWAKEGGRIMVFLSESKRLASAGTVFRSSVSKIEWVYSREPYAPRAGYDENSMLDLNANAPIQAFSMDLHPLSGPKALESELRAAVSSEANDPHPTAHEFTFDHDAIKGFDLDTREFRGVLKVSLPIDSRLEAMAQKWVASSDDRTRREGALALIYFRSDRNVSILRSLLSDTASVDVSERHGRKKEIVTHYRVREAAQSVLDAWGEPCQGG